MDGYDSAPRTGHSRRAPSTSASRSSVGRVNHLFFEQGFFNDGDDLTWTICETSRKKRRRINTHVMEGAQSMEGMWHFMFRKYYEIDNDGLDYGGCCYFLSLLVKSCIVVSFVS